MDWLKKFGREYIGPCSDSQTWISYCSENIIHRQKYVMCYLVVGSLILGGDCYPYSEPTELFLDQYDKISFILAGDVTESILCLQNKILPYLATGTRLARTSGGRIYTLVPIDEAKEVAIAFATLINNQKFLECFAKKYFCDNCGVDREYEGLCWACEHGV